jgi:hypothetical protein
MANFQVKNKVLTRNALLVSLLWWSHAESFSITTAGGRQQLGNIQSLTTVSLHNNPTTQRTILGKLHMSNFFESDFASAMPEKPKLTYQEQMVESATTFIADLESRLKEGVAPPPELEELRQARDAGVDASELAAKIYILLIEQGMLYDQDPDDGSLSPTNFDIKANLDVPEVKQEFAYLYKYGMSLISKGVVDMEIIKDIVVERLIKRTGLTPEEFDAWLGY